MKKSVFIVFLLAWATAFAQENYFSEPVKIPLLLTGTFAELRPNHFHSGIDIKTNGKTGLAVYPAADGYISRIAVSPTGFGLALYIDHPNGTTTVYGHLKKLMEPMASYVKNLQYKNEKFKLDLSIPARKFPVSAKEPVALSGNSGSSGGPHLHFEIRDQKTQEPINPLDYGLNIKDDIAPKILSLRIYPLSENSHVFYGENVNGYDVVFYDEKFHLKKNPVIPVYGKIGFGLEAIDYLDGSWSKCGINHLRLKVDGETFFTLDIDRFSYSNTRYLNSLIDYSYYITGHRRYYKTWKDPGNKLDFYHFKSGNGVVEFNDGLNHNIELLVEDSYGNTSSLVFTLKSAYKKMNRESRHGFQQFKYNQPNYFEAQGVKLECPAGAFYTDFNFEYNVDHNSDNRKLYSDIHKIHHPTTPIQNPVKVSVQPKGLPDKLEDKALLVLVNENSGRISSVGGKFENSYVTAITRAFGNFAVAVDTVPPSIKALSIRNKNTLTEDSQIRFRIDDNLSGIQSYHGTMDGEWVLFEYDAKNDIIAYTFDRERMQLNQNHTLKLEVTDRKNNSAVYEAAFYK